MTARIVCSCTTENLGIAFRLNVDPACPVHRNAQDVQTTAQTLQLALLALGQPLPMPERDMPEMSWTPDLTCGCGGTAGEDDHVDGCPNAPGPDDYGTDCTAPCEGPACPVHGSYPCPGCTGCPECVCPCGTAFADHRPSCF